MDAADHGYEAIGGETPASVYRREPARAHFAAEETTAGIGALLDGDLLGRTAMDRGRSQVPPLRTAGIFIY